MSRRRRKLEPMAAEPQKRAYVKADAYPEIGSSGLVRYNGYVQEDFLPDLRGKRAMKAYREIRDNCAVVGAGLNAIEMLMRQASVSVEPGGTSSDDKMRAEFVEECLHDMSMPWSGTLGEILTMLPFGHAYHEVCLKRRLGDRNDPLKHSKYSDGRIGWRKIALRGQETLDSWEFDEAGGIRAMIQSAAPDFRKRRIPIEKALLFRANTEKNNPEGRSVLRNAWFSWHFAKKITEIEAIGVERDLAGLPVMGIPAECMVPGAEESKAAIKTAAEQIVRNIRIDEEMGVVKPIAYTENGNSLYTLELLHGGGQKAMDTSKIIERHERRILMVMLADFVLMGHESVGSFALSSDKTALFATALGGWYGSIIDVFNQYAIPRLMAVNGWPTEHCPRMKHGDFEVQNLAALGDFISKLVGAGMPMFPDEALQSHLRGVAHMPRETAPTAKAKETQQPAPDKPSDEPMEPMKPMPRKPMMPDREDEEDED